MVRPWRNGGGKNKLRNIVKDNKAQIDEREKERDRVREPNDGRKVLSSDAEKD